MTTNNAHELQPGDTVVWDGCSHTITDIVKSDGWAWPIAIDGTGWGIALSGIGELSQRQSAA